ncbi:MAG: hypothetical protein AAF498_10165 [Pseudomonadota bacterium]
MSRAPNKEAALDLMASRIGVEVLHEKLHEIRKYLWDRDTRLMAQDGSCRDTLEGCEQALRDIWLKVEDLPPLPSGDVS